MDKSDMHISYIERARKSIKWYKKLFFDLLGTALVNSYVLYKQKTSQNTQFCDFRLQLIRQIVDMYSKPKVSRGRPSGRDNPLRLVGCHFPTLIPSTPTTLDPRKQCVMCGNTTMRVKRRANNLHDLSTTGDACNESIPPSEKRRAWMIVRHALLSRYASWGMVNEKDYNSKLYPSNVDALPEDFKVTWNDKSSENEDEE